VKIEWSDLKQVTCYLVLDLWFGPAGQVWTHYGSAPYRTAIETGFYPAWEQETSLHRLNECNPYKPTRSDFSK